MVKQYSNDSENQPPRHTQAIDFNINGRAPWGSTIESTEAQNGASHATPKAVNKIVIFR